LLFGIGLNKQTVSKPIKLVIADSNELIRAGLRAVFSSLPDVDVTAEAEASIALKSVLKMQPADVVVLDFTAPGFSIDVVPELLTLYPKLKFVAITPGQSGHIIAFALKAGVMSYVKKDCGIDEIIDAVRASALGNKFFCGQILDAVRAESIDPDSIDSSSFSCEPILLSEREQEVIKLIAEGYTNSRIAELLFLSAHTVNTHRKNIMQKLGVNNTAAIVMFAVKNDLVNTNKFLFSTELNHTN